MMPKLEYRLLDEAGGYPVLYYYQEMDAAEIAARFICDKFIKDGVVYERTSCACETLTYVIYVQETGKADKPALKPLRPVGRCGWKCVRTRLVPCRDRLSILRSLMKILLSLFNCKVIISTGWAESGSRQ